jgi:methionine-gamma-lyase
MSDIRFSPETQMMDYGYKPSLSEGAIKCPVFQTSTFVFRTAGEGKAFFEIAYGKKSGEGKEMGLIYSRINNPDIEILEDRLKLWDRGEAAAVFASGMAAISTTLMTFLQPGDAVLFSNPVYGGTHMFLHNILRTWGVDAIGFNATHSIDDIRKMVQEAGAEKRIRMVYVETPANPSNDLIDIAMCRQLADEYQTDRKVYLAVDNTYMGPLWQHPLAHGADIVLYSATKYIGGHSDLIAGAAVGSAEVIKAIKGTRTFFGTIIDPHTSWLLLRSLETLKVRMEAAAANAERIARYLADHPKVERVYYLGMIPEHKEKQRDIFKRQYESNGAMISFDIVGGEKEAFAFLDNLCHIKLAVSLGGTESLAEHPFSMTHADVPDDEKNSLGVTEKMVRLSVGIENVEDLLLDIAQALGHVAV